jgi:glycosyltransferase involved in cell wall biosynthesis
MNEVVEAPEPHDDDARLIRMCVVTTVATSIQVLYQGRLEYFQQRGFQITCVCAPSDEDERIRARGMRLHTASLTRAVNPWLDLRALWNLYWFFRREQFDLIEVGTPKGALVASVAAWLARAPCVVHLLHGLVYQSDRGLLRWLGRTAQTIPCRLAHRTFSVSASAREDGARDGLAALDAIHVLGHGSCNGVDLDRFDPAARGQRAAIRQQLGIAPDAVVFGFVGRMTRGKGIVELAQVWQTLDDVELLLVGEFEERDGPPADVVEYLGAAERVHRVGFQPDVRPYLAAMDALILPSHREGLGMVLLEAAAMGLPTIATDATGCRDAIEPGVTGFQVPVGDAAALEEAVRRLAADRELRARLGAAGREWVARNFEQRRVWDAYLKRYRALVAAARA